MTALLRVVLILLARALPFAAVPVAGAGTHHAACHDHDDAAHAPHTAPLGNSLDAVRQTDERLGVAADLGHHAPGAGGD